MERIGGLPTDPARVDTTITKGQHDAQLPPHNTATDEQPVASEPYTLNQREAKGWQDFANCLGVDPDLFFPERGGSTREAKEVCKACVVREDCLEYALANGEKFGIWGGLSERERRRIRRQRAQAKISASGATTVAATLKVPPESSW